MPDLRSAESQAVSRLARAIETSEVGGLSKLPRQLRRAREIPDQAARRDEVRRLSDHLTSHLEARVSQLDAQLSDPDSRGGRSATSIRAERRAAVLLTRQADDLIRRALPALPATQRPQATITPETDRQPAAKRSKRHREGYAAPRPAKRGRQPATRADLAKAPRLLSKQGQARLLYDLRHDWQSKLRAWPDQQHLTSWYQQVRHWIRAHHYHGVVKLGDTFSSDPRASAPAMWLPDDSTDEPIGKRHLTCEELLLDICCTRPAWRLIGHDWCLTNHLASPAHLLALMVLGRDYERQAEQAQYSNLRALTADHSERGGLTDSWLLPEAHYIQAYLLSRDPKKASRDGLGFTPQPVADWVVRSVGEVLADEFGLDLSEVQIEDPWCGSGVFTQAVLRVSDDHIDQVEMWEYNLLSWYLSAARYDTLLTSHQPVLRGEAALR